MKSYSLSQPIFELLPDASSHKLSDLEITDLSFTANPEANGELAVVARFDSIHDQEASELEATDADCKRQMQRKEEEVSEKMEDRRRHVEGKAPIHDDRQPMEKRTFWCNIGLGVIGAIIFSVGLLASITILKKGNVELQVNPWEAVPVALGMTFTLALLLEVILTLLPWFQKTFAIILASIGTLSSLAAIVMTAAVYVSKDDPEEVIIPGLPRTEGELGLPVEGPFSSVPQAIVTAVEEPSWLIQINEFINGTHGWLMICLVFAEAATLAGIIKIIKISIERSRASQHVKDGTITLFDKDIATLHTDISKLSKSSSTALGKLNALKSARKAEIFRVKAAIVKQIEQRKALQDFYGI